MRVGLAITILALGFSHSAMAQQADKATCLAVFEAGAIAFHNNNISNFASGSYHSQDWVMGYITNGMMGVPPDVFKAAVTAVQLAYDDGVTPDTFEKTDLYQCFTSTDPDIINYKQKAWTDQLDPAAGS